MHHKQNSNVGVELNSKSALEQECIRKLSVWKSSIASHDRGVMLGFFLGLFPLFPVAFFGFLISSFNYVLWKNGKLDIFEQKLIRNGLVIGFVNSVIGFIVLVWIMNLLYGIDWYQYPNWFTDRLFRAFHLFQNQLRSVRGEASV